MLGSDVWPPLKMPRNHTSHDEPHLHAHPPPLPCLHTYARALASCLSRFPSTYEPTQSNVPVPNIQTHVHTRLALLAIFRTSHQSTTKPNSSR